jgi:hypothetical protein
MVNDVVHGIGYLSFDNIQALLKSTGVYRGSCGSFGVFASSGARDNLQAGR